MKCPFCAHLETQVVETRESDDAEVIRRRRQCTGCGKRFTTYERIELNLPALVKKDGRRVEYVSEKLRASLQLALRKRPVRTEDVDAAIARIEDQLRGSGQREVPSTLLGEWVMNELRALDKVAYIRFASVYRQFADVNDFKNLVDEVHR